MESFSTKLLFVNVVNMFSSTNLFILLLMILNFDDVTFSNVLRSLRGRFKSTAGPTASFSGQRGFHRRGLLTMQKF